MKRVAQITCLIVVAVAFHRHLFAVPARTPSQPVTPPSPLRPFQLMVINPSQPAQFITLGDRRIDPLAKKHDRGAAVALAAAERTPRDNLRVVQFTGPLSAGDNAVLAARGLTIAGFLPDNACIVQATDADLAALRAQGNVRWAGGFAPEFRYGRKLRAVLVGRAAAQPSISVHIFFVRGVPAAEAQKSVAALATVDNVLSDDSGCIITATLSPKNIATLVALPGVLAVEYAPQPILHNNEAATIVDVRDMWDTRGFYGSNEIVAVADSGLDIGVTNNAVHRDFQDGAGHSRVLAIITNFTSPSGPDVASGHGTHVAGSVLGNGHLSGSNPTNNFFPTNSYAGMAPKAWLYFQAIGKTGEASAVYPPADLNNLFRPAYLAGARIHQNSWGSDTYGDYDNNARNSDLFTFNYPQMLICFSAGNAGIDTNAPLGVVDPGSIGSPGLAKNVLCVGATENNRPSQTLTWGSGWSTKYPNAPISGDLVANAITGMAAFSSRGPASDGRIKPDIVAPGTYIISCKTHANAGSVLWGNVSGNTNYAYSGGTSMACPLVSGAAAVFREYLRVNRGLQNQPAALIKAGLLCGATDINPGQYGTGATREIYPAPNSVQGWGRLNLENMLYGAPNYRMFFWTNAFITARTFTTNVVVYDTNIPFKAVLAWNDMCGSLIALDESYSSISGGGLMNDLDLRVVDPTGKTNFPLAQNTRLDLFYYTNTSAQFYNSQTGMYEAEKCTAPALPLTITRLYHILYDTQGTGGTFGTYIWAEGVGGLPGTVIAGGTINLSGTGVGFKYVPINYGSVPITSSNFFIGSRLITPTLVALRDAGIGSAGSPRTYSTWSGSWTYDNDPDMWIHALGTVSTGDHINTVEGVVINNPPGGTYQILVSGNNLPYTPVWWGVAYSGGFVPEPAAALALVAALLVTRPRRHHHPRI